VQLQNKLVVSQPRADKEWQDERASRNRQNFNVQVQVFISQLSNHAQKPLMQQEQIPTRKPLRQL